MRPTTEVHVPTHRLEPRDATLELAVPDNLIFHPSDVVLVEWGVQPEPAVTAPGDDRAVCRQLTAVERALRVVQAAGPTRSQALARLRYRFFTVDPDRQLWIAPMLVSAALPPTGFWRVRVSPLVELVFEPGEDEGTYCEVRVSIPTLEEWCAAFRGTDGLEANAQSEGGLARFRLRCCEPRLEGTLFVATAGPWFRPVATRAPQPLAAVQET
jgi:hypothetical protein